MAFTRSEIVLPTGITENAWHFPRVVFWVYLVAIIVAFTAQVIVWTTPALMAIIWSKRPLSTTITEDAAPVFPRVVLWMHLTALGVTLSAQIVVWALEALVAFIRSQIVLPTGVAEDAWHFPRIVLWVHFMATVETSIAEVIVWATHTLMTLAGEKMALTASITRDVCSDVCGILRGLWNPLIMVGMHLAAAIVAASAQVIIRTNSTLVALADNRALPTTIALYAGMNIKDGRRKLCCR